MNKNKKSFAARATNIINRYKRAKFDKTEREELDAALAALAQEQEAYKQANGIGEYSPENIQARQMEQMEGMQELPKFDGESGTSFLTNSTSFGAMPTNMDVFNSLYNKPMMNAPVLQNNYTSMMTGNPMLNSASFGINPALKTTATQSPAKTAGVSPQSALGATQGILPSLLGGAASMVGNMIMSAGTKPIELKSSYTPEQISLARQRERLSREAGAAQNVAMRGLRESGNRGVYLAGAGNIATGVSRGLSDSLTQSYMSEEMANLEQRNKAQDYQKQVDMANWQARQQAANDKRAYQSAAISTIPSVMTDINRIQGQNALLESLGSQNYMIAPSANKAWKDKLLGRTLYGTVRK